MTELSPAARAVLDAANKAYWLWDQMHPADADAIAAAALRAAADQVVRAAGALDDTVEDCLRGAEREHIRSCIYAIAAELEAQP